jgi:uncharacterized membrane protein YphA (DoxX/SURF4 family)
MSLSQSASVNLVPLFARIVLCLAFVPMGWNKLMQDVEFSGEDAKRLREMKVVARPDADPAIALASLVSQAPTPAAPPASALPTSDEPAPPEARPGTEAATGTGEPVRAKGLFRIALLLDRQGWSYQVPLAWIAAITELVGGVCVLIGLFTRFWSMGLAIAMAVAFKLTSVAPLADVGLFSMGLEQYNRTMVQLALFALAAGLVCSGAGSLSLDRGLFRGTGPGGGKGGRKKPRRDEAEA